MKFQILDKAIHPLLIAHAILTLLAGTALTVVTFFFDGAWSYEIYRKSHSWGFGTEYVSPYSESVIFTYNTAFIIGILAYILIIRSGRWAIGSIGLLVSVTGLWCFVNESYQLGKFQYDSWIWVSPVLMLALAMISFAPRSWFYWRRTTTIKRKADAG